MAGAISNTSKIKAVDCQPGFPVCDLTQKETTFAMVVGGGVDIKVGKRLSIRPIQVDYLFARKALSPVTERNNLRLGTGAVVHLDRTEVSSAPKSRTFPRYEFHVGYIHNKYKTVDIGQSTAPLVPKSLNGYNASLKWNFQRFLGAEFEQSSSWSGKESFDAFVGKVTGTRSIYTFTGGLQVKDNSFKTRFKPFGHALFGAANSAFKAEIPVMSLAASILGTKTSFLMIFGGGLDVAVSERFSLRAIQFDYLRVNQRPSNYGEPDNSFRLGIGFVIH